MLGFTKAPFTFGAESEKTILSLKKETGKTHYNVIRKGIVERSVWERESFEEEIIPLIQKAKFRIIPGVNRIAEKLPIKMVVFDRKLVLYQLNDPITGKESMTSLLTEHQSLANAFVELFEKHWGQATPMEDYLKTKYGIDITLNLRATQKGSKK
jgi:hypothetical protein